MAHGRGFAGARRRLDELDAEDRSAGVGDDAADESSAELTINDDGDADPRAAADVSGPEAADSGSGGPELGGAGVDSAELGGTGAGGGRHSGAGRAGRARAGSAGRGGSDGAGRGGSDGAGPARASSAGRGRSDGARVGEAGSFGITSFEADDGGDDYGEDAAVAGSARVRAGRRTRIYRAVMAAILVLAVGFGIGFWVGSPHRPADDSADAGFTRDMMTHHAQAVTMASLEYRVTDDAALRQIAIDITLTQQAQIGLMIGWLRNWDLNPTSTDPAMAWMPDGGRALIVDGRMPGMASDAQLEKLRTSTGTVRDQLFIDLMIQHHLGGIHMADSALKQAEDDQVLYLARQIKTSQQSEIDALQQQKNRLSGEK
ncbi:DUF305 domain-containing protein [Cryptosporangium aurantiacum]|uniref:Uncharacterized conserved protein, DUF305 family n=1 Tax=Cryptosporangium aurantiacum TaxID=134849 RepID=A0A1M7H6S2_9ACTN|nr:DUF305 domain-containing protein [Cryptosporangium aurantiacum]SHM24215.1 Uncharacterized conserved protein, DUF305 family [Cryptosporangium aurantiacum]